VPEEGIEVFPAVLTVLPLKVWAPIHDAESSTKESDQKTLNAEEAHL
jgi:hypothetical protein